MAEGNIHDLSRLLPGDADVVADEIGVYDLSALVTKRMTLEDFLSLIEVVSGASLTEIECLAGVSGAIQDQLDQLDADLTSGTDPGHAHSKLALDPAVADHDYSGLHFTATAGESLVIGDACYRKSDGKYWKADASSSTTMPGVVIATASISADATGVFLERGFLRDDSGWGGDLTVGGLLYVSATAGGPTQTAPSTPGDKKQIVGYAYAARIVFWSPCLYMETVT